MSDLWQEYLDSTQRLDTVRREAAEALAAEATALRAAREELSGVSTRLHLQRQRLTDLATSGGWAVPMLMPTEADITAAENQVQGGPAAVLAALHEARSGIDSADAVIAAGTPGRGLDLRPLLIYGPIAMILLLVQLYLLIVVDQRVSSLLVVVPCDATVAGLGFGLGWLLVGPVLKTRDRAPILGALACAAPVLLSVVVFLLR